MFRAIIHKIIKAWDVTLQPTRFPMAFIVHPMHCKASLCQLSPSTLKNNNNNNKLMFKFCIKQIKLVHINSSLILHLSLRCYTPWRNLHAQNQKNIS